jgi:hypothetical protein
LPKQWEIYAKWPTKLLKSWPWGKISNLSPRFGSIYSNAIKIKIYTLPNRVRLFLKLPTLRLPREAATEFFAEDILGLQPQNVMAIGDNFNDVSMLTYAGVGVAMGNAPQAVKEQADWVAPSVNLNGVARLGKVCFNLRNGGMGKWRNGEMGRWGIGEMGNWGDGEMGNFN